MIYPISYIPPVVDAAAKGKTPEDKPTSNSSYLELLPTDVHNLIMPYLVDPDLCARAKPLVKTFNDSTKSLADRIDAIHRDESFPDKTNAPGVVEKCRDAVKMIGVYREIAKKKLEFLPNPINSDEISKLLKSCEILNIHCKVGDILKERRFQATSSPTPFKYVDGRTRKWQRKGESRIYFEHKLDGCRVSPTVYINDFYIDIDSSATRLGSSTFYEYNFGLFSDMALAPQKILFVAREFHLEAYDLRAYKHVKGINQPTATCLYKLDYRFDKVTWDQERICLVGEKKGVVTELRFDSTDAEMQPTAKRYSHFWAKIAYVAKRVFKIIFVEGPFKAFEGTKEGVEYAFPSKRIAAVLFAVGLVSVGIMATGYLICALANPLFILLGVFLVSVGFTLGIYPFSRVVISPIYGVFNSVSEVFSSLKDLCQEGVFS